MFFVFSFLFAERCYELNKISVLCSYGRAKQRYSKNRDEQLSPGLHLASAAEAGALVSILQTLIEKTLMEFFFLLKLLSDPGGCFYLHMAHT